ncbi:unnamed protein product, partial [Didymodactylos carnosus]
PFAATACENGGILHGGKDKWCECRPGFIGESCEHAIDLCQTSSTTVCMNNGECLGQGPVVSCRCQIGFTGQRCETRI